MINYYMYSLAFIFLIGASACREEAPVSEAPVIAGEPAIALLNERIAQSPEQADLYAARAELYYDREAYDEAIQDLQTALRLDSLQVDYHHLLADVYLDYFRSRQALETMQRAAELFPERIPTLLKLSEFQYILKQYDASMRTIDRILRLDPQEPEAYFMFGMNFKETGDTVRAMRSFQEAVDLDPVLTDAWINLGQLHATQGSSQAVRYFDAAIASDTLNPLAYAAKGDYLRDRDRLGEAIALYREAARKDPQYDQAYFNAGLLYLELDSIGPAYEQFDLAIKVAPLNVQAYFFRGYAAEAVGDTARARSDYEHALRLAPDYQLPQEGLSRLNG